MARFSRRTAWDVAESGFAAGVRQARESGRALLDLTVSNSTACGFSQDGAAVLQALGRADSLLYEPVPQGLASARSAVTGYYRAHGAEVEPEQIVLTTSTSEAYSFLFRLLCDSGDAVLTGQPGYPLFDFLATLDDVVLKTYPMFFDFGWWIDFAELERRITERTRAVIVVHPNNPTGHATGLAERRRLEELCVWHGLALMVDEVFLDYPVDGAQIQSFARGPHPCLTFVLSGISKVCALPQMKVAWLAAFGPEGERTEALARLEVIADTFLSLNAPAQHALPEWLAGRSGMIGQIRERVAANLARLEDAAGCGLEYLPVEAGWTAILRLPGWLAGEGNLAGALLDRAGIVMHPGGFYGLGGGNLVVVSLLTPVAVFAEAVGQICGLCTAGENLQAGGY